MICKHCPQEANANRGLCNRCYKNKRIRDLYPVLTEEPEPTQEELDRIIAEQEQTLPRTRRYRKPKAQPRLGRTYMDWVDRGSGWMRGIGYHE